MSSAMSLNVEGLLSWKRQIEIVAMPTPLRRRLIYRVAKSVIRGSQKRVRNQVDLQGRPFAARSKKRSRKMLAKLARLLKVINNNSVQAEIGFASPVAGRIASKQQHGAIEKVNTRSLDKKRTQASKESPATRRQARALREAGFEIKKVKGKGGKKPSLKFIMETFTIAQAGVILRALRIKNGEKIKQSWTTILPARSFLGATVTEVTQHIEKIFQQMRQEISRGVR